MSLVFILPITLGIGHIEIVKLTWLVRGAQSLVLELYPVDVAEPWMIFNFLGPIISQTVHGLPLNQLIDEVSRVLTP